MLMETNAGNAGLVKEFAAANATFQYQTPWCSIYKMLPNEYWLDCLESKVFKVTILLLLTITITTRHKMTATI
jgi:hypothetical protein